MVGLKLSLNRKTTNLEAFGGALDNIGCGWQGRRWGKLQQENQWALEIKTSS